MSKSVYELSSIDYSLEKSHSRIVTTQLTAGNVVAQVALMDALLAAIQAITLGQWDSSRVLFREQVEDTTTPTDVNAQRERKWLVGYHDTVTNKKFRIELATAKLASNLATNSDKANLAATDIAAFVTAFEAIAKDPDSGLNSVVVDYIQHVGKRL